MEEIIRLKDVSMVYGGNGTRATALEGISIDIRPGEYVVITGESGAGKSTLLTILGGLQVPTGGAVRIHGVELSGAPGGRAGRFPAGDDRLRLPVLPPPAVPDGAGERDGAACAGTGPGRGRRPRVADALLASVGLSGKEDRLPSQLSGGEMPAGGHRAVARPRSPRPAGGRADGEPRQRDRGADPRPVLRVARPGEDGADGDAQPGEPFPRHPVHPAAGRAGRGGSGVADLPRTRGGLNAGRTMEERTGRWKRRRACRSHRGCENRRKRSPRKFAHRERRETPDLAGMGRDGACGHHPFGGGDAAARRIRGLPGGAAIAGNTARMRPEGCCDGGGSERPGLARILIKRLIYKVFYSTRSDNTGEAKRPADRGKGDRGTEEQTMRIGNGIMTREDPFLLLAIPIALPPLPPRPGTSPAGGYYIDFGAWRTRRSRRCGSG